MSSSDVLTSRDLEASASQSWLAPRSSARFSRFGLGQEERDAEKAPEETGFHDHEWGVERPGCRFSAHRAQSSAKREMAPSRIHEAGHFSSSLCQKRRGVRKYDRTGKWPRSLPSPTECIVVVAPTHISHPLPTTVTTAALHTADKYQHHVRACTLIHRWIGSYPH